MNASLEKINEHYFANANANIYPQIPLKSSKRKRLTTQTKPDIRYREFPSRVDSYKDNGKPVLNKSTCIHTVH